MTRRRRRPDPDPVPLPASGRLTAVTPQVRNPQRVSLFLDGEFVLGVDAEVAAQLGLRPGQTVDRALLEQARVRDEEARARRDALAYLAGQPRTRRQVERQLGRRGYSSEAVRAALTYLSERGWLDDREYARLYVRQQLESRTPPGERRLAADLRRRGVPPDLAAEVLAAALAGGDPVGPAVELARRRLERTTFPDRDAAYRRLAGFLTRRGYDGETVARALDQVLADCDLPAAPRRRTAPGRRRPAEEATER